MYKHVFIRIRLLGRFHVWRADISRVRSEESRTDSCRARTRHRSDHSRRGSVVLPSLMPVRPKVGTGTGGSCVLTRLMEDPCSAAWE